MNLNFLARRNVTIEPLPFDESAAPFEAEDTQTFTPVVIAPEPEPVLCTRPIDLRELHDLNQLAGGLFAYRLNAASEWQTGNILSVKDDRFGYIVLFQPKDKNLTVKIRPLNEIVHAWYEVQS